MKVAVVVSRFNNEITSSLLEGASERLVKRGVLLKDITVAHVPGTFEIPLMVKHLARTSWYDAIIALGCVIRGETIHFERICETTLDSLQRLSLETGVPITLGIVMADTFEQALERSRGETKHRGVEAADAAIEMTEALRKIPPSLEGRGLGGGWKKE